MNTPIKILIGVAIGFALGGALVGGLVYMRCAHHTKVLSEEKITLNDIEIVRRDGFDYHGIGFMEPNGSSLIIEPESGVPITIYKSQRMFQEGIPAIDRVQVVDGHLAWDDGIYSYNLQLKKLKTDDYAAPSSTPATSTPSKQ